MDNNIGEDGSWVCRCGKTVQGYTCSCGVNLTGIVTSNIAWRYLHAESSRGTPIYEELERYARMLCGVRNIPAHLAEEAVSIVFVDLVENIKRYDETQESFEKYAKGAVKRRLANLARQDFYKNSRVKVYIEEEGENGELVAEAIADPNAIDPAQIDSEVAEMRELARETMGTVHNMVDGEYIEQYVYDAAVIAMEEGTAHGWKLRCARIINKNKEFVTRRATIARAKWEARDRK